MEPAILIFSFLLTYIATYVLIPRLERFGIIGKDVNKPDRPTVAEMGGLGIVAGFTAGMLLAVFLNTFMGLQFNLVFVLAALITMHGVAFIGVVDDLLDIPHRWKAVFPLLAAVPLMAVRAAGSTAMYVPFVGVVDFGLVYIFILIPIAVAVCSNLTNMFAGFNGMESGMGAVMFATLSIVAIMVGRPEVLVISLSMFGALFAFYLFNRYPAKVFPGDVGNLSIGAAIAAAVIIGNIESAGVILVLPYIADFFIKAWNRFPTTKWWGECGDDGKLRPVDGKVRGLAQLTMKMFNGISERNLSLFFILVEFALGAAVIMMFVLSPTIHSFF